MNWLNHFGNPILFENDRLIEGKCQKNQAYLKGRDREPMGKILHQFLEIYNWQLHQFFRVVIQ